MNGKPYYSADNGFTCAAAGRGITEALQEHLNIIVRDEELATEMSRSQIQEEIDALVEDKERLEQQKLDCQDNIRTLTEKLTEKDIELSELNVELQEPIHADMLSPEDGRIEQLKNEIGEKTSELEGKQVEKAALETDLAAPAAIELDPAVSGTTPPSPKHRFTRPELIFTIIATLTLLGLVLYICVFYGSAGEKAFTAVGAETPKEELSEIIDSQAFLQALWSSPNLLILTFPIIFIMLAIVIHPSLEKVLSGQGKKQDVLFLVTSGVIVLLFDLIIAVRISRNLFDARQENAATILDRFTKQGLADSDAAKRAQAILSEEWPLRFLDIPLDIGSVLFAGFAVAFLLGVGLYYVLNMWKGTKEADHVEKQIRMEKNDRMVQLSALTTEIPLLEKLIDSLEKEKDSYTNQMIANHKHPLDVKIARLNTEKVNLQALLNERNAQVNALQSEINQCETKIDALSDRMSKQIIDIKKLEAQANEFVSGWCRYVAQSKTELTEDISTRIRNVQHFANETLEAFIAALAK